MKKRILLQVPEGLKTKITEIADKIEGDVFISGEPCYGACDLRLDEAKKLKCDKIIHYGHTKFLESEIPVEYVEIREKIDPTNILENNLSMLKDFKRIGLVSSLQFVDALELAERFLEKNNKIVKIGKGVRVKYPGQILGCNISSAIEIEENVDCFVSIGSGMFHPLGLLLETEKPVFSLNLEKNKLEDISEMKTKFVKQRHVAQALFKDAKKVGILVSTKPGQFNIQLAEEIKKKLNKKSWIFVFDEITPEKLEGIDLDAYISTACPRIAIENRTSFKKPILNPDEIHSG